MKLVFIPGLLCTPLVWGELNSLRDQYVVFDADTTQYDRIERIADSIIEHLPTGDLAVIGISMGGYIALDLALKIKDRVKKLILINSTANPVRQETISYRNRAIKLAGKGKLKDIVKMSEGMCYYKPHPEWREIEEKMAMTVGVEAYVRQQNAIMHRKNYLDEIHLITAETLVIASREDKIAPYQDSLQIVEKIPNATLVLLSQCGHVSTLEKGKLVKHWVEDFLK